jgi:hypothetical protein
MDPQIIELENRLSEDYKKLITEIDNASIKMNTQTRVLGYYLYHPFTNNSAVDYINAFEVKRPGTVREAIKVLREREILIDVTTAPNLKEKVYHINYQVYGMLTNLFRAKVLHKIHSPIIHALLVELSNITTDLLVAERKRRIEFYNKPNEQILEENNDLNGSV